MGRGEGWEEERWGGEREVIYRTRGIMFPSHCHYIHCH